MIIINEVMCNFSRKVVTILAYMESHFSHVQLFVIPWIIAFQAPLPNAGIELASSATPAL